MLVVPDVPACYLLDRLLGSVDTWVHLYTVDIWPDRQTQEYDLVEPEWEGYEPLRAGPWTSASIIGDQAQAATDPVEWVRGSVGDSERVYGYYVTDGEVGPLLWAEHICAADGVPMDAEGDVCVVWPLARLTYQPSERCIASGGVEVGGDMV